MAGGDRLAPDAELGTGMAASQAGRTNRVYRMTSVILALVAGVFLHVAFLERDRTSALLAVGASAGFLLTAVGFAR